MKIFYYDVLIKIPLRQEFAYKSKIKIKPGNRVLVNFKNKEVIGIILKENANASTIKNIKSIIDILDEEVAFDSKSIELLNWLSNYYQYPAGEVFFNFLPNLLSKHNNNFIEDKLKTSKLLISKSKKLNILTDEQKKSIKKINALNKFDPLLINGVTGSGKTEIYLKSIEKVLKNNKSVLILVPEINLIPQIFERFKLRFGDQVNKYHSKQSNKENLNTWLKAKFGNTKIIIGTRSAVMLPLKNLGMIIIDEEHDDSYKQNDGFRYSARDLAIKRSQVMDIPIILGSATPSFQTLKLVYERKFKEAVLRERVDGTNPPKLILLDIRNQPLNAGLSKDAIEAINFTLKRNKQVLIFINRRGFAPVLRCHCGWKAVCKKCKSNLVLHKSINKMMCHRCELKEPINDYCPKCLSKELIYEGVGTETVEEFLKRFFPQVKTIRIDMDSTRKVNSMEKIIETVKKNSPAILIGTQMLAKGHDFPKVDLGIILNIDNGILAPEFNSQEKTAQLLIQVSGRVGRGSNSGRVIVQTFYPDNSLLKKIKTGNYMEFAKSFIKINKNLNLPPYSAASIIRIFSTSQDKNHKQLKEIINYLKKYNDELKIYGPSPSAIHRIKNKFRSHITIQAKSRQTLIGGIKSLLENEIYTKIKRDTKLVVDIDPYDYS